MGSKCNIPEHSTCDYLPVCVIDDEEEGIGVKKKKSEKSSVSNLVHHNLFITLL